MGVWMECCSYKRLCPFFLYGQRYRVPLIQGNEKPKLCMMAKHCVLIYATQAEHNHVQKINSESQMDILRIDNKRKNLRHCSCSLQGTQS